MYLTHTNKSINYIQKHREIYLLMLLALQQNKKLTYRGILKQQSAYRGIGGIHRFIKYCKRLGMATDII